jgi:SAP domain-containing ribonucleoprotein
MATDFSRMTVIELRQELKRRNLPQTGKKADLIDRLATFDSDQTTSEPRDDNPVDDDNHESHDLPTEQDAAEPQNEDDSSNLPQQEDAVEAAQSTTAEEAPQAPITTQDSNSTSEAVTEPPKSAEASASIGDSAPEEVAAKVAATEAIPATEIITDAVSRKRRSRSPPPENEISRKRARPSDEQSGADDVSLNNDLPSQPAAQNSSEPKPIPTSQTATDSYAATRETPQYNQAEQHAPTEERDWQKNREPTPQHFQERQGDEADEPMPDYDRDVAPAQHPATSALYIKNFMRPLREQVLRDYLVDLAALPGAAPDPDCVVEFYLDQIRTHALVSFTSVSAASRVRTALHGTVWPNERNRKELWVDFIPEDKVVEWIDRQQPEGGRGASGRWEVHYEPDDNGNITANLINAEMEPPARRNSTRQPLGPPPVPTGPARNFPGVEGAPLGPRGRGTNHYRQGPLPPSAPIAAGERDHDRDFDRGRDLKTTRAYPPLQYKPVSEEVAARRLNNMNAHITKDRRRDLGRPDEINRYTFEDGEDFVDRGKEAFIGIRPPHRERERRRMGIGRGGGGPGGNRGPARRRTPSPRRPPRNDDGGYRGGGGGGRNDFDRSYRDRNDDRRDRDFGGRDRFRDDVPRSRFDGQPLPTFSGGGGGRGGRWGGGGGGGGGRRDRY